LSEIRVREADAADNPALTALSKACPSGGGVRVYVDRSPDYFALTRLQGDRWWVGVAEVADGIVGSISAAARTVYLHGAPRDAWYVSDLKVAPRFRGPRLAVADRLVAALQEAGGAVTGFDAPGVLLILAGNRSMERRTAGPRGLARLDRFATLRSLAIPALWAPRGRRAGPAVGRAAAGDLEEMAALWRRVASRRQFAPALDAGSMARTIAAAPGLAAESYLLARGPDGRLEGFLAHWDQRELKRLVISRYPPHLAALRRLYNLAAAAFRAPSLPGGGSPLRIHSLFQVCVPADRPEVLRHLLLHACAAARRRGAALLQLGLDRRDPLLRAVRGLCAQATDAHAYATTAAGRYHGPSLDDRPLHVELALV